MLVSSSASEVTNTGVYRRFEAPHTGVMNVKDTRRSNLKLILAEVGGPKALADRIDGWSPSYVSQLQSAKKSFGDAAAKKIEIATGRKRGWMDSIHGEAAAIPRQERGAVQPEPTLAELRNAINSTQMALGAMAAIMAGMRPAEGAAVAALFRGRAADLQLPDMGLSAEFLEALRLAIAHATGSASPRTRPDG